MKGLTKVKLYCEIMRLTLHIYTDYEYVAVCKCEKLNFFLLLCVRVIFIRK